MSLIETKTTKNCKTKRVEVYLEKNKSRQMYIHCSLLFAVLRISWLASASSCTNSINNSPLDQLTETCPSDGIPVCGIRDKQLILFSNDCLLNEVNKDILQQQAKVFRKIPLQHCIYNCQLSCSDMYEPVCAQNVKTYQKQLFKNQCKLTEYICKTNMGYLNISLSECLPNSYLKISQNKLLEKRAQPEKKIIPIPCTTVFKPVCGSYMGAKSSFKNECLLNAENIVFNRDWRIVNDGMCPQDYSKTRRHKAKPTKSHSIEKRSFQNKFYNSYQDGGHEYNTNFVDNKNELNVPPSHLYVYMPQAFQAQYLNHETSSYQHSIPVHEAYDEILNKIVTFPPADMPIMEEENKTEIEEPISEKSIIGPLPFAVNRMNFNYLSDQNLIHDINRQSIPPIIKSLIGEDEKQYYHEMQNVDPGIENEDIIEMQTTARTSSEATQIPTTTSISSTTSRPKVLNEHKQLRDEEITKANNIECKFGSVAVCATLPNGTVRTFETICEMMTANVYLKNTWAKLHDGDCDDCKYTCSRDYQPLCVSRNGVNYTMVNECYYNMGICMDKKSKWQKLSNAECERYTRIIDKYANSEAGFPYTSNYFVHETTAMPGADSLPLSITNKSLKIKYSKNKKRIPNSKRAITRSGRLSSHNCCLQSHKADQIPGDNVKCECWSDTTLAPSTESYIMRLVKDKDEEE